MKWQNEKGHTDNLLPLLKALGGGTIKKSVSDPHPEFFEHGSKNGETKVTEEGEQFYKRCLELFPFLKRELNG